MKGLAISALMLLMAACDIFESDKCLLEGQPAVQLTIVGSGGTDVVSTSARLIVRSGSYADTTDVVNTTPSRVWQISAADNRAGTYEVTLMVAGYAPWTRSSVVASPAECGIVPAKITAALIPL
jgi:hypothetical protein